MAHIGSNGAHTIRLSNREARSAIAALSEYLEQCDSRNIASDGDLFLSAEDRLTRDDIVTAISLCINILRIGTTLVFPNGERFGREDINSSLSVRLALALATLDELSGERGAV